MFYVLGLIALALVIAVGVFALNSLILMLIVNWVLTLFEIAFSITFIQSFGLVLLIWFVGAIFNSINKISINRD